MNVYQIFQVSLFVFCGFFSRIDSIRLPESDFTDKNICCIQQEWEALIFLDYGTVFIDQNTAYAYINATVHAAYSLTQKKVYFNVLGVEQSPLIPKPEPYDTILLYDFLNGISYMVGDDGQCQKSSLEKKMSEYCVPENAKNLSSGVFGSGNATRPVHTFQYTTDNDIPWQITATVYENDTTPFRSKECVPISASFFTPSVNPDSGSLYNLQITDIGPIKTKGVFDVPKSCLKS